MGFQRGCLQNAVTSAGETHVSRKREPLATAPRGHRWVASTPLLRLLKWGQRNPAVSSSKFSVAKGISTLTEDDETFASLRDVVSMMAVTFRSQPAALSPIADEGCTKAAKANEAAVAPRVRFGVVVLERYVVKASPDRPHCKAIIASVDHRAVLHEDVGVLPVDVHPIRPCPIHPHVRTVMSCETLAPAGVGAMKNMFCVVYGSTVMSSTVAFRTPCPLTSSLSPRQHKRSSSLSTFYFLSEVCVLTRFP